MRQRISRQVITKIEPNGRVQQIKKEIRKVERRTLQKKQIEYCQSRLALAAKAVINKDYQRAAFFLDVASKIAVTEVLQQRCRLIKESMMSDIIKSF